MILHACNLAPTSGSSLVVRRVSPGWIIVLLFSTKYVVPHFSQIKVPITSKFLSFHLILYTTQWTSGKKIFDLDKNPFFWIIFQNVEIYRHFGPPFAQVLSWFVISFDENLGTRDLRLDSSRLFYLRKFLSNRALFPYLHSLISFKHEERIRDR